MHPHEGNPTPNQVVEVWHIRPIPARGFSGMAISKPCTFVRIYDEQFARQYGFWRPYLEKVVYRYLDCGDLRNGFARVKCKDCGHEYLLAFSCKRRHFCPSCHQKRVVEFGEWLCMDVLKKIPHRHFVFSIPKILRRYFLYDRKLLADLSRCAWESLKIFLRRRFPKMIPFPALSSPCRPSAIFSDSILAPTSS
jgi:hypothetical protein